MDRESPIDITKKAMYLRNLPTHFDVVVGTATAPGIGDISPSDQPTMDPEHRFYVADEQWQRIKCALMNLRFVKSIGLSSGSPSTPLTAPSRLYHIRGDGNCLFRSVAYILTGSERQHMAVRRATIEHMRHREQRGESSGFAGTLQQYLARTKMNRSGAWGTQVEIAVLSHLLDTRIVVYKIENRLRGYEWQSFDPTVLNGLIGAPPAVQRSMYIKNAPNHYM